MGGLALFMYGNSLVEVPINPDAYSVRIDTSEHQKHLISRRPKKPTKHCLACLHTQGL